MRIVILGAGQVGATLARNLVNEGNDVTLVDIDENRLCELRHRLDIKTVHGLASYPNVLIEAGIEAAHMLIAVTDSDEINMIGCQIAYSLFRTPTKIARIRAQNYYDYPQLFRNKFIAIDVCISPEKLVTEHIKNLIDYPGVTQVLDFADGKLLLVTIRPYPHGKMVGKTILQLYKFVNSKNLRIIAIFRNKVAITLTNDSKIVASDDVLFIASPHEVQLVLIAFGRHTEPNKRIIIAGGGFIGTHLAQTLENNYKVKVIERDFERASKIATQLHKGTVLQGDIADRELLLNENIEFVDVFCAVSNNDETNMMSCFQAKRLGARQVMALVNRHAYVELIDESVIDQAISPHLITIGSILTKIRRGNMVKIYRLKNNEAEAIELIVYGTLLNSKVIGRRLCDLELPPSCTIAAVIRNTKIYIDDNDCVIASGDHIIVLLLKKRYVSQIESLFQVDLTWQAQFKQNIYIEN